MFIRTSGATPQRSPTGRAPVGFAHHDGVAENTPQAGILELEKLLYPDLYKFVEILKAELDITEIEVVQPDPGPGPLFASVTTDTVFASNFIEHGSVTEFQLMDEKADDAPPDLP